MPLVESAAYASDEPNNPGNLLLSLEDQKSEFSVGGQYENEFEEKKECLMFLESSYARIEQMLKNDEFGSFQEFESELKAFQLFYAENGPPGPHRMLFMLEFVQQALTGGAYFFTRRVENELELQRNLAGEVRAKLECDLREAKSEYARERDTLEAKLRAGELQLSEKIAAE